MHDFGKFLPLFIQIESKDSVAKSDVFLDCWPKPKGQKQKKTVRQMNYIEGKCEWLNASVSYFPVTESYTIQCVSGTKIQIL